MSSDYPSNWDATRNEIYKRDNYQCQNCGAQGGPHGTSELHAHHIVPKSKGGTHQRSNLISVCKDCHNAIHGNSNAPTASSVGPSVSTEEGLIRSVFGTVENISESEVRSNSALGGLIDLFEELSRDGEIYIDDYTVLRLDIIRQAFSAKEEIERYESVTRSYLNEDVKKDIDCYIEAAWESIQTKISIIGHTDSIFMEFSERQIQCSQCNEVLNPNSEYCKNCGKRVHTTPQCGSCKADLEDGANYCPQCGNEVAEGEESDNQLPVDEEEIDKHAESIENEIEEGINKSLFVELLEEKFRSVWIEDFRVVWNYCPNCGLERGVLSHHGKTLCMLCKAEWKKRGILNRHWEGVKVPNVERDITNPNINWEKLGREKNEEDVYQGEIINLESRVSGDA